VPRHGQSLARVAVHGHTHDAEPTNDGMTRVICIGRLARTYGCRCSREVHDGRRGVAEGVTARPAPPATRCVVGSTVTAAPGVTLRVPPVRW